MYISYILFVVIKYMNILFYGNCQLTPLQKTLNLDNTKYIQTVIECFDTEISESDFDNIIKKSDIIIMQLTDDNYRNKRYLSTTHIIYHSKENCKIILLNNFYFNFYYIDTKTVNIKGEKYPYHHLHLYECYKNGNSIDYYIQNFVNNSKLKSKYELECLANNSLTELDIRYESMLLHKKYSPHKNIFCIPVTQYIRDNYKENLLFYTINHPSKILFHYICEKIVDILNIDNTIDYEIDVLNHTRCILYKCIQKIVCFNIEDYSPFLYEESNIKDIADKYYNKYKISNIEL